MIEVKLPSIERLKQVLAYEPDTGLFRWRIRTSIRIKVGDVAGYNDQSGYVGIRIDGQMFLAHCLAWFYVTGKRPKLGVDHRDGDKQNNKWLNLRLASKSQNGANARRSKRNTSGFKGVHFWPDRKKWCAQICVEGKRKTLGLFDSPEAAHQAYVAAATKAFGEFARAA